MDRKKVVSNQQSTYVASQTNNFYGDTKPCCRCMEKKGRCEGPTDTLKSEMYIIVL